MSSAFLVTTSSALLFGLAPPHTLPPVADLPSASGIPAHEERLLHIRDIRDRSGMRRHAWNLFSSVTADTHIDQPSNELKLPVWMTWWTLGETMGTKDEPLIFRPNDEKSNTEFIRTKTGGGPISGVRFNNIAYSHIRDERLYAMERFVSLKAQFDTDGTPTEQRRISDFDRGAIATKSAWFLVAEKNSNVVYKNEYEKYTLMPVWNGPDDTTNEGGPKYTPGRWKSKVLVDETGMDDNIGHRIKDANGIERLVVSIKRFYRWEICSERMLSAVNKAIGDPNRQAKKGDQIVLVGLHIASKEIPDWIWTTVWWHPDAFLGEFRKSPSQFLNDRPPQVARDITWSNYLLDTAFDMETPRELDNSPNACFNPWLEANVPDSVGSNCMSCHQKAAWPANRTIMARHRIKIEDDDKYFSNRVRTDYIFAFQSAKPVF